MGFIERLFAKQIEAVAQTAEQNVIRHVTDSLSKAQSSTAIMPAGQGKVKRYQFDPNYINANMQQRKKPGGNVSYDALRNFSIVHEISRACINFRKRQLTGLEWDIVTTDSEDTQSYDAEVQELKQWFRNLGGTGIGYRKFLNRFIEDLLVLDAITLERQKTYGGDLFTLIPIDATTIRLLVDESGGTPLPPNPAYRQYIRGQMVGEYTTEELIYDLMNPRNDSPYGLAPLESLIVIVSSSLKAGMYNLGYLTDGNIPEGFIGVPETWTPQMIQQFQNNWDAAMAGDETATSRLKMVPGKSSYTPAKKREDMQFEVFNDWLMKVTCALFEVPPVCIGFSPKTGLGGKGFADQQDDNAAKKGALPLTMFIREVFDKVIAEDLGKPHLRFSFKGLENKDEKLEAETNAIRIGSGQRTINEVRTDEGLDPIEGLDKPIYAGNFSFIDPESLKQAQEQEQQANEAKAAALKANPADKSAKDVETTKGVDITSDVVTELRKYRRYALGRIKDGKGLKKFESNILPENVIAEVNAQLTGCADLDEAKQIFSKYFDDMQLGFLADVVEFKQALARVRS